MRVLAMLHLYTPHHNAGAELAAHALLRALVERGHAVDVVLSQHHPQITQPYTVDGVTVHPRIGKGDPIAWLRDPERAPHLIVTHLENTVRASILGRQHGVPVVHLLHNTFQASKDALTYEPAMVVANTQWMLDDFRADWHRRHGQRPMPHAIVVRPVVRRPDYQVKPGKAITLVNLTVEKGAEVFYALAKRFPDREFLGVVGAYGAQVRLDLPNVEIIEHVPGPDMPAEVYGRTKVLLAPSSYESYGRVAAEAICSGIPVIAHPTPGLRECLGDAGIFHDRDDIDAWEAALRTLLTPRGWSNASKRALTRAADLDPTDELAEWTRLAEVIGGRTRHRR